MRADGLSGLTSGTRSLVLAVSLLSPRAPPPRLCAPLNTDKYGRASLHVSLDGTRSIHQQSSLPPKPADTVRLVFVSDTHSQLEDVDVPPGDVLCHTGDITFCAQGGLDTLEQFNNQLKKLPHTHKVVIAGNHDRRIEQLGRFQVRRRLHPLTLSLQESRRAPSTHVDHTCGCLLVPNAAALVILSLFYRRRGRC